MKYWTLAILFIVPLLVIGCTPNQEFTAGQIDDLQTRLIAANADIDTYTMTVTTDADMTMNMLGQDMEIQTTANMDGAIDRPNKKLSMVGTTSTGGSGMNMEIESAVYIIGNEMYMKTFNTWLKMSYDIDLWNQQDQIQQTIDLIKSGSVVMNGEETIEGKTFYKVTVTPDMAKVAEMMLKQQQQNDLLGEDFNLADMVKEFTQTIWVNKQNYIVERSSTHMVMEITTGEGEETSTIFMDMTVDTVIDNINKPVSIVLPEEAEDARSIDTQVQDSITGNVIRDARA